MDLIHKNPSILTIFVFLYTIISVIIIILERRRPEKTMAWLLIIVLLPPVGIFFYIFIGRNWKKHKLETHEVKLPSGFKDNLKLSKYIKHKDLMELIKNTSGSPLYMNNKVQVLKNGEEKFKVLKEELLKAKESIHLEYYIFRTDTISTEIKNILIDKVREGVSVKMILDKVGCVNIRKKDIKEMRDAGIDVVIYTYFLSPILKFVNTQINYRNHRKIVVIDNKVGFVGGINVGDDYLGKGKLGFWRDTHLMIKGDAVCGLQEQFIEDFCKIKQLDFPNYKIDEFQRDNFEGVKGYDKPMQLAKSGPDSENPAIMQSMIKMINEAEEHIYITTPYFIPTEGVMDALKIAALSGIEIRILFPGRYDHLIVYYASMTYLSEIVKYGAKVYFYKEDSFMHSKVMTVDSNLCTVGTANMDVRSYELNYEINAVIYDEETTRKLEEQFLEDIHESILVTKEYFEEKPPLTKFLEALARIFSNLM